MGGNSKQSWVGVRVAVVAIVILGVAVAAAVVFAPPSNTGFKDAAAVLGIITAGALGIERLLEGFWTVVGMTKGTWWPLDSATKQLDAFVLDLNTTLAPFFNTAEAIVKVAAQQGTMAQENLDKALGEIRTLKQEIDTFKDLAPGNERAQLIAMRASQAIKILQQKYPDLKEAAATAQAAVDDMATFVASFQDNPGRRLISIYLGALLGLAITAFLGLNVLEATLQSQNAALPRIAERGGIVLTGLLMGLGSTPTHEVISLLQSFKTRQKADSLPKAQTQPS